MEDEIVVGKMIGHYLKANHMTMKQLGEKLGKTESTVSKWVSGASTPMAKDLSKMTNIFNTDINTLMFGGKSNNRTELSVYIGKRIESLRNFRGISRKELARKLNLTEEELIEYENGNKQTDIDFLHKLTEIFDVNLQGILPGAIHFLSGHAEYTGDNASQLSSISLSIVRVVNNLEESDQLKVLDFAQSLSSLNSSSTNYSSENEIHTLAAHRVDDSCTSSHDEIKELNSLLDEIDQEYDAKHRDS